MKNLSRINPSKHHTDSKSNNNKKSIDKIRDEERRTNKDHNKKSEHRRSGSKDEYHRSEKNKISRNDRNSSKDFDMKSPTRGGSRSERSDSLCGLETRELKMLRDALGPEAYLLEAQGFTSMYDSIKKRSCRRVSKDTPRDSENMHRHFSDYKVCT